MTLPLPELHGVDVASHGGGRLLEALTARSKRLAAVATTLPQRMFSLRSPWAPGVSFVGAEAPLWPGMPVGASGSGTTLVDATVSCLGELVERVSQVEGQGDVARIAALTADVGDVAPDVALLMTEMIASNGHRGAVALDWVNARVLATGHRVLLPADWCLRRRVEGPLRMAGTALSTGVAAGATADAATLRALLELVERDAVAQWWVGGRRGRPLSLPPEQSATIDAFITDMRQGVSGRRHWLLDVSTDLAIPCVVALSVADDGCGLACGMAARLDVVDAARAALFEMFQMELAVLVVELKRRQRGDDALNAVDRQHLARATNIDAATCELLHPIGTARAWPASSRRPSDDQALADVARAFADASITAALVDLQRPSFGIPVVAAFAPALQRYPSNQQTARLQQAIDETGGGARWTKGVSLC